MFRTRYPVPGAAPATLIAAPAECDARRMCGELVSMFLRRHLPVTFQKENAQDVFDPVCTRIASDDMDAPAAFA